MLSLNAKLLKAVFSLCEDVVDDRKTRDQLSWTAGNEDPVQGGKDTSRMGTARVIADTRIIVKEHYIKYG